jgi:hypothetical protein
VGVKSTLALGLTAFALGVALAAAPEEWALAGREGGCAPIESLKRKWDDLPAVRNPDDFERWLRVKGLAFTRKAHGLGSAGEGVEFVVPAAGLALMMVPRRVCAATSRP